MRYTPINIFGIKNVSPVFIIFKWFLTFIFVCILSGYFLYAMVSFDMKKIWSIAWWVAKKNLLHGVGGLLRNICWGGTLACGLRAVRRLVSAPRQRHGVRKFSLAKFSCSVPNIPPNQRGALNIRVRSSLYFLHNWVGSWEL